MAYERQNFEDGEVLYAEELNHIEDGIIELENEKISQTELDEGLDELNTKLEDYKGYVEKRYPFGKIADGSITITENKTTTLEYDEKLKCYLSTGLDTYTVDVAYGHYYIVIINGEQYEATGEYIMSVNEGGSTGSHWVGNVKVLKELPYATRNEFSENDNLNFCFGNGRIRDTGSAVRFFATTENIQSVTYSIYDVTGTIEKLPAVMGGVVNRSNTPFLRSGQGKGSALIGGGGVASGNLSLATGGGTQATGLASSAQGSCTIASGTYSHAEGQFTTASGNISHAEGTDTIASGKVSHAEGQYTIANGGVSHAEGNYTIATGRAQHVEGQYNIEDTSPIDTTHGDGARKYLHIVGNGDSEETRSNAHTLDWDGNAWYQGKITSENGNLQLGKTVLTEQKLKNIIAGGGGGGEGGITDVSVADHIVTQGDVTAEVSFVPQGTISAPTLNVSLNREQIYIARSKTSEGSVTAGTKGTAAECVLPTLTTSVDDETLVISWTEGSFKANTPTTPTAVTMPTFSAKTLVTSLGSATAEAPVFTGEETTVTLNGKTSGVAVSAHEVTLS